MDDEGVGEGHHSQGSAMQGQNAGPAPGDADLLPRVQEAMTLNGLSWEQQQQILQTSSTEQLRSYLTTFQGEHDDDEDTHMFPVDDDDDVEDVSISSAGDADHSAQDDLLASLEGEDLTGDLHREVEHLELNAEQSYAGVTAVHTAMAPEAVLRVLATRHFLQRVLAAREDAAARTPSSSGRSSRRDSPTQDAGDDDEEVAVVRSLYRLPGDLLDCIAEAAAALPVHLRTGEGHELASVAQCEGVRCVDLGGRVVRLPGPLHLDLGQRVRTRELELRNGVIMPGVQALCLHRSPAAGGNWLERPPGLGSEGNMARWGGIIVTGGSLTLNRVTVTKTWGLESRRSYAVIVVREGAFNFIDIPVNGGQRSRGRSSTTTTPPPSSQPPDAVSAAAAGPALPGAAGGSAAVPAAPAAGNPSTPLQANEASQPPPAPELPAGAAGGPQGFRTFHRIMTWWRGMAQPPPARGGAGASVDVTGVPKWVVRHHLDPARWKRLYAPLLARVPAAPRAEAARGAEGRATCTLVRCSIENNGWNGAWCFREGSKLVLLDTAVRDNPGSGVGTWDGGVLLIQGGEVRGHNYQAVEAVQRGSTILMRGCSSLANSLALNVFEGAHVRALGCKLNENTYAGARAVDGGTLMELRDCEVVGNRSVGVMTERRSCAVVHRSCTVVNNGHEDGLLMDADNNSAGLNDYVPAGGSLLDERMLRSHHAPPGADVPRFLSAMDAAAAELDAACARYDVRVD
ncbi:unnamed protein product [Pedinophyceae sp. YPF-701]|nr:unnamed protein product [Pedinophyceae sp. YPF-701]